jgi:hypothetical protein
MRRGISLVFDATRNSYARQWTGSSVIKVRCANCAATLLDQGQSPIGVTPRLNSPHSVPRPRQGRAGVRSGRDAGQSRISAGTARGEGGGVALRERGRGTCVQKERRGRLPSR